MGWNASSSRDRATAKPSFLLIGTAFAYKHDLKRHVYRPEAIFVGRRLFGRSFANGQTLDGMGRYAVADVQGNWLEAFYAEARPGLLRRIGRKLGCHATASDLIQDVFLRLHERAAGRPEDAGAYVNRSLSNAVVDHLRAQRVRRDFGNAILPEQLAAAVPSPQDVLEARQDVQRLDAVIRGLPERTRHIFLLHKIHGRSYGEIAGAMGISRSAVEKHMARAMLACKAASE